MLVAARKRSWTKSSAISFRPTLLHAENCPMDLVATHCFMDLRTRISVPDGPGGNSLFYGFENENLGNGIDPWPDVQLDAIAMAAAALCRRHCWGANRVIAHKEWTSNKPVDPRFDMNQFRARVADFL
jgi:hypothetical protein